MSILKRLFGGAPRRDPGLVALYAAIVGIAREPRWYRDGAVPDTLDGRFDMVAAVLSLVLLRLEREGEAGAGAAARLTEVFVDDMDGQLRQAGIGDIVVGKHVGRMMGALGGRLSAYRAGSGDPGRLGPALVRNLYRGTAPPPAALSFTTEGIARLEAALAVRPLDRLLAGEIA